MIFFVSEKLPENLSNILDQDKSIANFLSVDLQRSAFPVFEKMLQRGVLVRPIANYGMPNHLRFTIGLEEENSKALDALEQSLIQ